MRCKDCPVSYTVFDRNGYQDACGAYMEREEGKTMNRKGEYGCRLTAYQAIARSRRLDDSK